jgi:hypothetical protein
MAPGQDEDRRPRVDEEELIREERQDEVEFAGRHGPHRVDLYVALGGLHVVHLGKAFRLQEFFGRDVLWGDTGAGDGDQPESGRLRRRLRSHWPGRQAKQPRRPGQGQPAQEAAPRPAFHRLNTHGDLLSCADAMPEGAWGRVEWSRAAVSTPIADGPADVRWRGPGRSVSCRMGVKEVGPVPFSVKVGCGIICVTSPEGRHR